MSANSFDKTSFGWQIQQMQQRFGEWLELKFRPLLSQASKSLGVAPDWLGDILLAIGWGIFGLVVAWLLWQIYKLVRPYILSLIFSSPNRQKLALQEDPTQTIYSLADWLQQAQRMQAEGNYGSACRALYMALLQRLSDAELIASQASRTDREYLNLLHEIPQSQPCQVLIATHEQLWFGNAAISAETFERCQQAYREVERHLNNLTPRGAS
ncbi:hypothetical protein TUMEXPCC7403_02255 [Tumidithrix helvetica PCC 7403]|uniref:DUF4129 domain-containing protein n=1 Tax=Tumidithrix helvetica TaxID=3457545 RepID=UPI003CC21FC0